MTPPLEAGKLKLLLAKIKVKQSLNQRLTATEENLVAECHRIVYSKPRETWKFDADGKMHVIRTVDAEPVMNALKDYMDVIGPKHKGAAGARLFGSLDPITASIFSKQCGAGIGTKEFAAFVKKKLQDSDYKRFRFGGA